MTLRADADLLRRVLDHLVDNAIRYAPDGSEARVTTVRRTAGVEIRDADSGPGIAPDLREKVFERFVQVDAGELTGRATNGLGLTFCKLAIEAHGGTIWVEDGGPGAVFSARLPQ